MKIPETLKKSVVTGVKVLGYILASVLLTVITSVAFNEWLEVYVNDAVLYAVINVALASLAKAIKEQTEEGSTIRKVL